MVLTDKAGRYLEMNKGDIQRKVPGEGGVDDLLVVTVMVDIHRIYSRL